MFVYFDITRFAVSRAETRPAGGQCVCSAQLLLFMSCGQELSSLPLGITHHFLQKTKDQNVSYRLSNGHRNCHGNLRSKYLLPQHLININDKMHFGSIYPSARQIHTGLQGADFTTKLGTIHIFLNHCSWNL